MQSWSCLHKEKSIGPEKSVRIAVDQDFLGSSTSPSRFGNYKKKTGFSSPHMFTEEFRRDIYYYTVHQTSRYTFLFFTNTIKRFDSGAARAKKYKCYGSKSSLFIKEKEEKNVFQQRK